MKLLQSRFTFKIYFYKFLPHNLKLELQKIYCTKVHSEKKVLRDVIKDDHHTRLKVQPPHTHLKAQSTDSFNRMHIIFILI